MKARLTPKADWGGGTRQLLTAKVKVALVVTSLLASLVAGVVANPFAAAQKVGNPGNINLKIVGGNMHIGIQDFNLTPETAPQCSNGTNDDDGQDTLIDYPADPDCTSALDDSEVASGFQPHQDTTITGTIAANGTVTVPQSGIFFPPIYQYQSGAVLTVNINPTAAGTGTLNPLTGAATLTISVRLQLQGSPSGVSLGSSCFVGPWTMAMTTGTTNPPGPNTPITGVPYDASTSTLTAVDNAFSVPGASGCGPLGLANSQLNTGLGVPAAAGTQSAVIQLGGTPTITKGVNASNVPSVSTGNAPLTVNFNGTGSNAVKPITTYAWDFGDGGTATGSTASHNYSTPGTYVSKLTVTDSEGDKDSQTKTIVVTTPPNIPPVASISASGSGGIVPYTVTLNGSSSTDPDGTIVSYDWDFGDGSTHATVASPPAHTYTAIGNYNAKLTVTDNRGGTNTATKVIAVVRVPNVPPTAAIQIVSATGTVPRTFTLSGSGSTDPDGTVASYAWDFGDGNTATGPTTSASYGVGGTYTITLTVTDNEGATNSTTVDVDVSGTPNNSPVASFTSSTTSGTAPLTVSYDGSASADSDGTIAAYAWAFGNGQNGSGATPAAVTYTIPGVYTVKLTVTDNRGGKGNVTKTITVNPPANVPPVAHASATPSNGATPFITQLSSAGSSDADGAITGYSWDLGNGDTSTSPNPSATYIVTGTTAVDFTATLTVTDNDGASSVASTVVHVLPPNAPPVPVIVATPTSGAAPLTVNVNGASSTDDGTIANYDWDWGDASAHTSGATAATASHVYAQGTYTLRLSVTDDRGAVRSTTSTIVVSGSNVRPIAAITALPTAGFAPLVVQLSSTGSNDPDGSIVKYSWSSGSGQTALGTSTQFTYPIAGTYTVTLTVTDNKGGTGTATEQINVDPPRPVTDKVRLQFTGALSYTFDGSINSGNLRVLSDSFGITQVDGSGTYTGPGGSAGSVSVSLNRFLWFNAYIGSVSASDPLNGITSQSATVFLGPLSRPSATAARGAGTGFVGTTPFTLGFTIDDRA